MERTKQRKEKMVKAEPTASVRASVNFPLMLYQTLEEVAKEKVSLAWVIRDAAEQYMAEKWPLLVKQDRSSVREATMIAVDQVRRTANSVLHPERKIELGQFMTPASVAQFMAALFSERHGPVRLLDAGAGIGSLTAAFIDRWGAESVHVTAYEIDETLTSFLRDILSCYGNCGFEGTIINRDFIQDAVYRVKLGRKEEPFTHAILNPPYRKINSGSVHRALLRAVGLETVNLYTAFVGLAIVLMRQLGEVVAITPRSFCNGLYYKPFREWMLARASLDRIHLFHSRKSAFNDDAVLQENVIIKLVCGKK